MSVDPSKGKLLHSGDPKHARITEMTNSIGRLLAARDAGSGDIVAALSLLIARLFDGLDEGAEESFVEHLVYSVKANRAQRQRPSTGKEN